MRKNRAEKQKQIEISCDYGFNPMKARRPFCWECEQVRECFEQRLQFHFRIPDFITDNYMHKLSGSAWKVLCYCVKKANNNKHSRHHGKCWPQYKDIAEVTGLSQNCIGTYLKELVHYGLISHTQQRKDNCTINNITILWQSKIKRIQDVK